MNGNRHHKSNNHFILRLMVVTDCVSVPKFTDRLLLWLQICPHAAILNMRVCSKSTTISHPIRGNVNLRTTLVARGSLAHGMHLLPTTCTAIDKTPQNLRTNNTPTTRIITTLPAYLNSSLGILPMSMPMPRPLQQLQPSLRVCLS